MTEITRSDVDWTLEGRAQLGHEVLDLAPAAGDRLGRDGFCFTGWYAWQLGIGPYRQATVLRPLLYRLTWAGLVERSGGARTCREACRGISLDWYAAVGIDPTHTHMEACYWRLAIDRHDAHEQWAEYVQRPRWWTRP